MKHTTHFILLAVLLAQGQHLFAADPAESAAKTPPPKITHDWPGYTGPDGTYADQSKVPILDDLTQAALAWVSDHADLGYGKTTSKGGHCYGPSHSSGSCSLIVAGGLVIAGYFNPTNNVVADDILLAVDAATGQTRWKRVYAGKGYNRGASKHVQYGPTPAAADGKVFHLGSGGRVYAVELATGKELWEVDLDDYPARYRAAVTNVVVTDDVKGGVSGALRDATYTPLTVIGGVLMVTADRLYAYDAANGRELWRLDGGRRMPLPAKIEGRLYALCAGPYDKTRLVEPRTGKVLWTEALGTPGITHTSEIAADGRLFIPRREGEKTAEKWPLTAFALGETGARMLWQSATNVEGDAYMAYRDGVIYANMDQKGIQAFKADDGTLLSTCDQTQPMRNRFHLWGDRIVLIGDHCHESLGAPCTYQSVTPGLKGFKQSGAPLMPRTFDKYAGVCGYMECWMRPAFADGYMYTRAINRRTGVGAILCWDLRAVPEDARVTAARAEFAAGRKTEAVRTLDGLLSDPSRHTRLDACRALRACGEAALPAAPALVRLLGEWFQPDTRAAFDALAGLGPAVENPVMAAVNDSSPDVRKQVWQIFWRITPKSAAIVAAARKAAVQEADEAARGAAFDCLVAHGADAAPVALAMLDVPAERRVGFAALGRLGTAGKAALPTLLPMLKSMDEDTYRQALEALLTIADLGTLPDDAERGLKALLLDPGWGRRQERFDFGLVVRHLQRYGDRSRSTFIEACGAKDWQVAVRSCYGLSLYGAAAAEYLPLLEATMKRFAGHKDYQACIREPIEMYMSQIRAASSSGPSGAAPAPAKPQHE